MAQGRVGWCVQSLDTKVASVRYRALLAMAALDAAGQGSVAFTAESPVPLRSLSAVVFVKNFSLECARLAQEARELGKPVILDLCDNIFIDDYGKRRAIRPSDFFLSMATRADAIVVTTEALATVVRGRVNGTPVFVVPDGMDDQAATEYGERAMAIARKRAQNPPFRDRVERYLRRPDALRPATIAAAARSLLLRSRGVPAPDVPRRPKKKKPPQRTGRSKRIVESTAPEGRFTHARPARLLWFGVHGAPHARFGMLDLLAIQEDIERIARECPAELIVVSNSRDKYEEYIRGFEITTRYEDWSPETVARWLAKANVVLIPNSLDAFSLCKSANRAIHALSAGVPVVATPTPAMLQLSGCVALGSFHEGIRNYLEDPTLAKRDVAKARKLMAAEFGAPRIANLWTAVLQDAEASRRLKPRSKRLDFVIALNLIQDLDLALPVIDLARSRGLAFEAWSSIALLRNSPRVAKELAARGLPVIGVMEESVATTGFPRNVRALLTIAETNLGPHRFTRTLTRLAKAARVRTATMQHGLENVGLTYSDDVHSAAAIDILADRIYLWGGLETLHPDVAGDVAPRCLPVGCSKPARCEPRDLGDLLPAGSPVVGVFENLHWHRYSDAYRDFFLQGVSDLALAFPGVRFLVKPHHAGMWLTSRFSGERPRHANLLIADPADPDWEPHTAGDLLCHMDAVITTPSTVALDAARQALPVAVVAHDVDIPRYRPLFQIRNQAEWREFVDAALAGRASTDFRSRAAAFVESVVRPGDAAARILNDLLS